MTVQTYNGNIPLYKNPSIDWNDFIDLFEAHVGYKVRDFHETHGYDGLPKNEENECEYLDFWHWLLDDMWEDMDNGSYHTLFLNPEDCGIDIHWTSNLAKSMNLTEDYSDLDAMWPLKILQDIFAFMPKDHPAYNAEDQTIEFWVEW